MRIFSSKQCVYAVEAAKKTVPRRRAVIDSHLYCILQPHGLSCGVCECFVNILCLLLLQQRKQSCSASDYGSCRGSTCQKGQCVFPKVPPPDGSGIHTSAFQYDTLGFPDHIVGTGGGSVFSDTAADDKVCLLKNAAARVPDEDNPFFTSAHSCSRGSAFPRYLLLQIYAGSRGKYTRLGEDPCSRPFFAHRFPFARCEILCQNSFLFDKITKIW